MKLALIACTAAFALLTGSSFARTPPVPAPCTTGKLVIWLNTQGSGAAGSVFYKLQFTNLSGHRCRMLGYPGVSAVNLRGHRLGSPASRIHARRRPVILRNGATAKALLQIVEVGNFSRSTCHQVTAAGLRVYPPGQQKAKIVPFPFGACSRSGPVFLNVKPVR